MAATTPLRSGQLSSRMAVFFMSSAGLWPAVWRVSSSARCAALLLQIFQNLPGCIRARPTGQARSGMRARSAQIEVANRRAIARPIQQWTHGEKLIERQLAVKDVAAGEPVSVLQILGRDNLVG